MIPADQTQRERLARIEAPEPAWEQHLGVEWHSSETVEPREIRISIRDEERRQSEALGYKVILRGPQLLEAMTRRNAA